MAMGDMCLLCSLLAVLMVAMATASDEAALLAFKAQINHGGLLASWNRSAGFCSWEGVTCSRRRPAWVVALLLNGTGLAGALSPAIGNLTFLRTLDLSFNSLHGGIPASLGRLQGLYLDDNAFSGTFPVNLSSCVSMNEMVLDNNKIGGRIPAELGEKLTSLTEFSLSNNSFTGHIPASLANLSHLQILDLTSNQLVGSIPPGLESIQNMQYFSLYDNLLSGMLPLSLYNWSSLEVLDVALNMLYGTIPDDIGSKFPKMKALSLSSNHFSGPLPSSISNMSDLTRIFLWKNRFSGYVPPTLGRLGVLQYLNLADNRLEANDNKGWEFITSLANCSRLQILELSVNPLGGQLPGSIVNLSTTLRDLSLTDNMISGVIPAYIGNLVGLTRLVLANTSISGVIPESIGKLKSLIQLGLYNNSLSGSIPPSLGNLSQLNGLIANNGNLEGPIPASLGKLKNLFELDLSMNYRLNGSIPREIFKLPSLSSFLDLSYNSLSGPLPNEVGSLANLNRLILSGNQLFGKIPDGIQNRIVLECLIPQSLKNIKGLSKLNLTMNKFSGNIPEALGSIGNLQELYLAHNNLSGSIPVVLQNLTSLSKLDVSFNNLQGEVPDEGVFRNITYLAVAGNINLCGGTPQLHLAPCSISKNKKNMPKSLVISLATAGAFLFSLSAILIWILCKKLKPSQKTLAQNSIADDHYMRIPYHALLRGTNGFSEVSLLGRGSYERTLAVKVFNIGHSRYSKSFEVECEAIRRIRHRCLIKIITSCSSVNHQGQEFKALVFEFMPNGNLDGWLHPKSQDPTINNTLSLARRLDIAVDIVDAIEYLHNYCQPLVIHCDLKPSNILLAEDMSARVGDFGISRILQENTSEGMPALNSSTGIRGSIGYVAPVFYLQKKVVQYNLKPSSRLSLRYIHKDRIFQGCLVSVLRFGISCSKIRPRERALIRDAAVEMRTPCFLVSK
ncbi:hypothetical protein VPH35_087092 [Triticum aestivum]